MTLDDLAGVWSLVGIGFVPADGGGAVDLFGPEPRSSLTIAAGWFSVVIAAADRTPLPGEDAAAAVLRTMMAYAGPCRLDGDVLITDVEVAWHPDWSGSRQVRTVTLTGDRLTLTSPEQTHPALPGRPGRGVIVWRRAISPSA